VTSSRGGTIPILNAMSEFHLIVPVFLMLIPLLRIEKADSCGVLVGSAVPALDGRRRFRP
jgi:hypothetical protein